MSIPCEKGIDLKALFDEEMNKFQTTPPPSSKSSFWNVAAIVPKPDDMAKSSPIGPSLVVSVERFVESPERNKALRRSIQFQFRDLRKD